MNRLMIDLENCYGIKKLQAEFDFAAYNAYAIYAPERSYETLAGPDFQGRGRFCPGSKDRISHSSEYASVK